jgi:uncharacterized protein YhbP (UPF0306 family)
MATEVPQPVLDYLGSGKTLTLATASTEGVPHAATYMYANDGLSLYFWAKPTSATVRHLRSNPRVSFAIDEYVEDWNKAKGIQGAGECGLVSSGDEVARCIGMFAKKYPSPSSAASTTNISFFKVTPSSMQFIDNAGAQVKLSGEELGMDFHREEVIFTD